MSVAARTATGPWLLAVGDERRPRVGRAIVGSLIAAAVFVAFAFGVKETQLLSIHSPWANDPYDAVTSFAIFFLPLVAGLCLARVTLCRRDEPLPVERVEGLLRGARLTLGIATVALLSDWISVVAGANTEAWSGVTVVLVAALALVSGVTAWAVVALRRGEGARSSTPAAGLADTDWLADLVTVAVRTSAHIGPLRPLANAALGAADRGLVRPIRAYPVLAAAAAALLFGAAIAVTTALEEGPTQVVWLFLGVGAAGMFAFLAAGGSYLRLVARTTPLLGFQRRFAEAFVLAAASVPVALAFRDELWWIVGANAESAGIVELETLLLIVAMATFGAVLVAESVARLHPNSPYPPARR